MLNKLHRGNNAWESFTTVCGLDSYQLIELLFHSSLLGLLLESGDVAEQRNNQSEFSFELEELSSKFAGIKEPVKKV